MDHSLSAEEMALVQNADWILTKRRIIDKVFELLGQVSENYATLISSVPFLPAEVLSVSPKIYKGEAYQQLPYVLLDHPRFFKGADAFAIRSFFWWGKSFSIHLHLAGKYKAQFEPVLLQCLQQQALDTWHTVRSNDQWQHHFETYNYIKITPAAYDAIATQWQENAFIKLGRSYPLGEWETAVSFFTGSFANLLTLLHTS